MEMKKVFCHTSQKIEKYQNITTIQKITTEKTPDTLPSLTQNYHSNLSIHGQEAEKTFWRISLLALPEIAQYMCICNIPDRGVQKSETSCAIMAYRLT